MVITGSSLKSSSRAQELCSTSQHDGLLYFTAGVHPHDAKSCDEQTLPALRQLASHPRCCAIGECGLDFNRSVCIAAFVLFTCVRNCRIIIIPSKLISLSYVTCALLQQDFILLSGDNVWLTVHRLWRRNFSPPEVQERWFAEQVRTARCACPGSAAHFANMLSV